MSRYETTLRAVVPAAPAAAPARNALRSEDTVSPVSCHDGQLFASCLARFCQRIQLDAQVLCGPVRAASAPRPLVLSAIGGASGRDMRRGTRRDTQWAAAAAAGSAAAGTRRRARTEPWRRDPRGSLF